MKLDSRQRWAEMNRRARAFDGSPVAFSLKNLIDFRIYHLRY